jgi:hypothetical protein
MVIGHLPASYLISQFPSFWGDELTFIETIFVIFCGMIIDLDYLLPLKNGRYNHHLLPSHTPIFAMILFTFIYFIFQNFFRPVVLFLGFLSLLFHFFLDDLGHILYKIGFKKENMIPQIFWFYPFDKRREYWLKNGYYHSLGNVTALYLSSKIFVIVEIMLVFSALLIFINNQII